MSVTFTNSAVRRQDRLLDEHKANILLINGEYGVLSMTDQDGSAYGIPINYVWNRKNSIYLHGATEGRKLQCISHNNKVSFCIIGNTNVLPEKFSTEYESIILECTAYMNIPSNERMDALSMLIDKYSPNFKDKGLKYAEGSFGRTEIIRLEIQKWSGKCKKVIKDIS